VIDGIAVGCVLLGALALYLAIRFLGLKLPGLA
jgi:hypothetical protein